MAAKPAKPAAPAAAGAPAEAPKKGFPLMLVLIVLVLGVGAGGGVAWFMLPKGEAAASEDSAEPARRTADRSAPLQYVALAPAFVVNLADEGSPRYLQAEIQVSTRDAQTVKDLETHMPAVRNALLMLFSRQTQAELRTAEGREKLQADTLAAINGVLEQETGAAAVDGVFFTNFVTQ